MMVTSVGRGRSTRPRAELGWGIGTRSVQEETLRVVYLNKKTETAVRNKITNYLVDLKVISAKCAWSRYCDEHYKGGMKLVPGIV